jgi:hypothetical protein
MDMYGELPAQFAWQELELNCGSMLSLAFADVDKFIERMPRLKIVCTMMNALRAVCYCISPCCLVPLGCGSPEKGPGCRTTVCILSVAKTRCSVQENG